MCVFVHVAGVCAFSLSLYLCVCVCVCVHVSHMAWGGYKFASCIPVGPHINANVSFFPDSQLLNSLLTYYVRGDESRRAQNAIIEFAISLKTRKRNLFTYYAFKCGPAVSSFLSFRYHWIGISGRPKYVCNITHNLTAPYMY